MDQRSSKLWLVILPGSFLIIAFLYIALMVQPVLYFHHLQPPFILTSDFLEHYANYPGGLSEWVANFIMQSFYYKWLGPVVFYGVVLCLFWLAFKLMNCIHPGKLNPTWALVPLFISIALTNNYNFPFSVIISMTVVLLLVLFYAKRGRNLISRLVYYTSGAVFIYYFSGSGYLLLFSMLVLFFSIRGKVWDSLAAIVYIVGFSLVMPRVAYGSVFPLPMDSRYFYFFPWKPYFMAYEPSFIFYTYLFSVPVLLAAAGIASIIRKIKRGTGQIGSLNIHMVVASVTVIIFAIFSHYTTFNGDGKKIAACDYYCYNNNAEKTARAATSLENYSFSANLNYNLVMGKTGILNDNFFNFFQIAGPDALFPDVEFSSEMSFIAADFYYDLGHISEARHHAYEALVNFPYSPRALQILVKTHLITGEYRAAERCLHILSKGLIGREMVKEYLPYVEDTALISSHKEFMEKRSFIPERKELSPFIEVRLQELLKANDKNKRAYEYLMLYYLLDSRLESFMELYREVGKYFDKPVDIYEEAILMYGKMKKIPAETLYSISPENVSRLQLFNQTVNQYQGNERLARNALYPQMGKSYIYYLRFVYPRIVRPGITEEEYDEQPI